MADVPTCGGEPINSVITMSVGSGLSLALVRSAAGFCFSSWTDAYGKPGPFVEDALRERVFPSAEEASWFFRQLRAARQ